MEKHSKNHLLQMLDPAKVLHNTREYVALKFLFTKSIPGHGDIFEEVSESELQPGDILLFPMDRSNDIVSRILFKHAAVYCGDGEVIHFQGTESQQSPGVITKEGLVKMKKERGQYQVYRKKDGVVLNDFRHRVRTAMNSEAKYDPYTNNCIHFALYLLGLQEFYSNLVRIQDEGDNSCSDTAARGRPIRDGGQAQQEPPPVDVGSGQGAEKPLAE
ncbi:putative LOC102085530 [Columba livia]|uniref:Putative LOC102085530 n=1 Tax=Columba livia TaxID=8932 RepID=A0A2I0M6I3_COLLI|nr:putative LOC102085530 [Columba livia]